ncbi:MAG: FRG domain-containing protein [Gammaproteobacteria bacterium]
MKLSWPEFKAQAAADLESDGSVIYRGQRDARWGLVSAVHRTSLVKSIPDLKGYADFMLPQVHDALEAWVGRSWDLKNALGLAEFLAFVQHNGFPTPLLDWTASPYIAAYFAFEGSTILRHRQKTLLSSRSINACGQLPSSKSTILPISRHMSQFSGQGKLGTTNLPCNRDALLLRTSLISKNTSA